VHDQVTICQYVSFKSLLQISSEKHMLEHTTAFISPKLLLFWPYASLRCRGWGKPFRKKKKKLLLFIHPEFEGGGGLMH
jgi:hypothetical protein